MCKGKTTILATHAVDFFHLADKIILVDQGKLMGFGTMESLKDNQMMYDIMQEHNSQRQEVLATAAGAKKRSSSPGGMQKSLTGRLLEGIDNKDKKGPGLGKTKTFNPMSRSKLEFKRIEPKRDDTAAPSRDTGDILNDLTKGQDFTQDEDTNTATGSLIKKATTMMEEVKKQATKKSNDDKKDDGKLIEKTEEEDEILQEASWDTYAKVLKQSGGLMFWIPFGAFVVANVFLWEQCNGFWTRFADKTPEEQQDNLNWYIS